MCTQWCGVDSNRMERGRGLDVAKKIKDKEHFGRSTIVRVGAQFSEACMRFPKVEALH
jgi:hypothetical protein